MLIHYQSKNNPKMQYVGMNIKTYFNTYCLVLRNIIIKLTLRQEPTSLMVGKRVFVYYDLRLHVLQKLYSSRKIKSD